MFGDSIGDEEIKELSKLWTTERDISGLIEVRRGPLSPAYVISGKNGFVLIENRALHKYVVEQMMAAGVDIRSMKDVLTPDKELLIQETIKSCEHLWNGERPRGHLIEVNDNQGDFIGYLIYDDRWNIIRIRDDAYDYVIQHMKDVGIVPISFDDLKTALTDLLISDIQVRHQDKD